MDGQAPCRSLRTVSSCFPEQFLPATAGEPSPRAPFRHRDCNSVGAERDPASEQEAFPRRPVSGGPKREAGFRAVTRMRCHEGTGVRSAANCPTSVTDRRSSGRDRPTSATDRRSSARDRPTSVTDRPGSARECPTSVTDRPTSARQRASATRTSVGLANRRQCASVVLAR